MNVEIPWEFPIIIIIIIIFYKMYNKAQNTQSTVLLSHLDFLVNGSLQ